MSSQYVYPYLPKYRHQSQPSSSGYQTHRIGGKYLNQPPPLNDLLTRTFRGIEGAIRRAGSIFWRNGGHWSNTPAFVHDAYRREGVIPAGRSY